MLLHGTDHTERLLDLEGPDEGVSLPHVCDVGHQQVVRLALEHQGDGEVRGVGVVGRLFLINLNKRMISV